MKNLKANLMQSQPDCQEKYLPDSTEPEIAIRANKLLNYDYIIFLSFFCNYYAVIFALPI